MWIPRFMRPFFGTALGQTKKCRRQATHKVDTDQLSKLVCSTCLEKYDQTNTRLLSEIELGRECENMLIFGDSQTRYSLGELRKPIIEIRGGIWKEDQPKIMSKAQKLAVNFIAALPAGYTLELVVYRENSYSLRGFALTGLVNDYVNYGSIPDELVDDMFDGPVPRPETKVKYEAALENSITKARAFSEKRALEKNA